MFADQLNSLCSRTHRPVTNRALARALTASGCPISTAYLSQLRTGIRTSPSAHIVATLAAHFGVPVDYFYPATTSAEEGQSDPGTVDDLRDPILRRLLACTHDLSPTTMELLATFAHHLRRAEKLPARCADTFLN